MATSTRPRADSQIAVSAPFAPPRTVPAASGETLGAAVTRAVNAGVLSLEDLPRTTAYVNGRAVPPREALGLTMRPDDQVNLVFEPGDGGGGRKDLGQVLVQFAVIAASFWIGGPAGPLAAMGNLVRQVAAAAVMVAGSALTAGLFRPEDQGGRANDRYALQSASNTFRPFGTMPLALGAVVVAPDLVAKTFTRQIGDDVWIYGILGLHYGPCVYDDLKIGDTLVSSMAAGEAEFVDHLTPGPRTFSLYPNDTDQTDFTETLNKDGVTATVRAAGSEGERFELDLFFPEGLFFAKDDGRVETASASVVFRSRAIDEEGDPIGAWEAAGTLALSDRTRDPKRVTHVVERPLGRYEFELIRNEPDDDNEKRHDTVLLTAIRAIAFRKPVTDETLAVVEFRVKATALNQGSLAPITCRVEPICDVWDPEAGDAGEWGDPQPTSNPAALSRWLLTGPAAAKPLEPVQADAGLTDWFETCAANDWRAGHWLQEGRSQKDALALLGASGRATLYWNGSAVVAACWAERPAPRQLFSGRNLRDRTGTVVYPEPLHGLRVEFANIDQRGEADEVIVYAPGYGAVAGEGVTAATRIEALRLEGQTTKARAWLDGLWEIGRRRLQRRVETWTADVDYLTASFGDRVLLNWRAVGEGRGEARVRARRFTGGLVSGLRLDQPVEMEDGESYAADLRFGGQVVRGVALTTVAGASQEIVFATPRTEAKSPRAGDLVVWGLATEGSTDLELIGIEPGEGLTARLTGQAYVADQLMAAEAAAAPALNDTLTGARRARPPQPRLLGVQPSATGIRVSFDIAPWAGSPVTGFAVRWRATPEEGDGGWTDLAPLGAAARTLVTPSPRVLPVIGADDPDVTIDVEITTLSADGQASEPLRVEGIAVTADPDLPGPLIRKGGGRLAGELGELDTVDTPQIDENAVTMAGYGVVSGTISLLNLHSGGGGVQPVGVATGIVTTSGEDVAVTAGYSIFARHGDDDWTMTVELVRTNGGTATVIYATTVRSVAINGDGWIVWPLNVNLIDTPPGGSNAYALRIRSDRTSAFVTLDVHSRYCIPREFKR